MKETKNDLQPGVIEVAIPLSELAPVDVSEKAIEARARAFILGSQTHARRKEIREELEEKVTRKIGKKGKYLTDKLFELIEGVYVIDKRGGKDGREVRYYQVPPNLQAITYALDRVLGKPVARTEVSEEKKGIVIVESIIRNLAGDKTTLRKVQDVVELPNEKDLREMQEASGDDRL